jgi:hypothetical protein
MTNENAPRFESDDLSAVIATLEVSLGEHLVGFEVIDRDLSIPAFPETSARSADPAPASARSADSEATSARADVVGVDRSGRLVLVLFVDGGEDSTAIAALEVLAFARANLEFAAQHWSAHGVSAGRSPIVVLIADHFDARLKHVLAIVDREALRLFEVRALRSASSVSSYLSPCEAPPGASGLARASPEDLLSTWPGESRALAADLSRRLARIDDALEPGAVSDALVWRNRGRAVCTLAWIGGVLQGEVGADRSAVRIETQDDADSFLERALREQMHSWSTDADGGERKRRPADILERRGEPLLTAEEMAAFRD